MVSLRMAVAADVVELSAVVRAAFVHYVPRLGVEPAPMGADYPALVAAGRVWIAIQDGAIVGVIVLVPGADQLLVETIAVQPSKQGQGVGFRLMMLAEEETLRRGLPAVTLYTNQGMTENLAYYPRLGYVEIFRGEHYGFHRVFFRKTVRPVDASADRRH
jgi:GNAT superfamily N-acetyltransferase